MADALLLLLYAAVCAAILLRVSIESTGYTSPDSEYYMEAARSLREGEQFYIHDLYGLHTGDASAKAYFTAWPVGYPTLIYMASWLSRLDLFWASKLLNLLFIGFGFLLMRHINRQYAFVLASIYGAFSIIEMYSYTWSEGVFIYGCLCFAYLMATIYNGKQSKTAFILLLGISAFIFVVRYIGIFTVGFLALATVYYWLRREHATSNKLLLVLLILCIFIGAYLGRNYYLIGHPTGIARIHTEMESIGEIAAMTIKSLAGEFFLIRRYYFTGTPDLLTWATIALQLPVLFIIGRALRSQGSLIKELRKNTLSHSCLLAALLYLALLVFLRSFSQFDPINYRLLSPFTFLVLFAAVHYVVALPEKSKALVRAKVLIFCFFVISLLLNLPKEYLLGKLLQP
ncbi:hypothetical protein [Pontibacter saemangeumensis]|uniref:hypothetical protein n=1 Tax=Pontibacter saemangeumensis TaxID=1084525 RepID=UPI0031EB55F8